MKSSVFRLSDGELLRGLAEIETRSRTTTAELLVCLGEVDARRLYAPAGFPSMYAWCVEARHYSEDEAARRIRAARMGRDFPKVIAALADGRLHLTAALLLKPHMTHENAEELIAAVAHKSKAEIEVLLATRFPSPDVPTVVRALPVTLKSQPVADTTPLATLLQAQPETPANSRPALAPVKNSPMPTPTPPPRIAPLAPQRFAVQFTASQQSVELLKRAESLLGHKFASEHMDQVFALGLEALVGNLEKQKFATTDRPRACQPRTKPRGRYIPASIRREVTRRDGGRCTYVAASGRRCDETGRLEFDHIEPVAKGGRTSAANLRLRCRAHNQLEAEIAFGAGFMHEMRSRTAHQAVRPG